MKVSAEMPSNIALIKYMGKSEKNVPLNGSLSYTTNKFSSYVEIEPSDQDRWEPSRHYEDSPMILSESESRKFMSFFSTLKQTYSVDKNFVVRSCNSFPMSSGLASSASSFAALTVAAHRAFTGESQLSTQTIEHLSHLSRQGSGSSCRSFFSPWAIWDEKGARQAELNIEMNHYVVILDDTAKEVSSSQAHQRVQTSLNFSGRKERAEERLKLLMSSLLEDQWKKAFEICWNEMWDMHSLFETSRPPFGYMKPSSVEVLELMGTFWSKENDGPLVTMDAGANVHLLFKKNQEQMRTSCLELLKDYKVL